MQSELLRNDKLIDINEGRNYNKQDEGVPEEILMLAKHFTLKSLSETLITLKEPKIKCQKLIEICQGIEKMCYVHHKLHTRKIRPALFKLLY